MSRRASSAAFAALAVSFGLPMPSVAEAAAAPGLPEGYRVSWPWRFNEGVAVLRLESPEGVRRWGVIDKSGAWVIQPLYEDMAVMFGSERIAGKRDGRWHLLDRQGKLVKFLPYASVQHFSEGRAPVEDSGFLGLYRRSGAIDAAGNLVVPTRYEFVSDYSSGVARALSGGKFGVLDRNGSVVVPFVHAYIGQAADGIMAIGDGKQCWFADAGGRRIFPGAFYGHGYWSGGRTTVSDEAGNRHWVLDREGRQRGPVREGLEPFSEGLAAYREGGKAGFVGLEGEVVVPARFDETRPFREGAGGVRVGDKWGYIDRKGEWLIQPRFDWTAGFAEGLAVVREGDRMAYVDRRGAVVIDVGPVAR